VPFPPGQAADIFTRVLVEELSQRWPSRAFVENRGGAAGAPAMEAGARAAPDGYTLTVGSSGTLGVNPSVLRNLPYDVGRDFAFISNITNFPLVVVVHPSSPATDLPGLLRELRARPGQIPLGLPGVATSQHLAAEMLMHRTGTRFNTVSYRGSGPAVSDLLANVVPVMFDTLASSLPHIRAGAVRPIVVTTPTRATTSRGANRGRIRGQ
jgi:tripartite-type tricarboxylate transporter receptor subunit TctC